MSFSSPSKAPDLATRPAGKQTDRLASNQGGVVLPVFWGRERLSGTFISKVFNLKTVPVKDKSGKGGKGGGGGGGGTQYYASFAMALCHGPISGVREIWFDENRVWSGSLAVTGDSTGITITGRGLVTLYHGTETQGADAHLNNTALPTLLRPSGEAHGAYRGVCYAVFNGVYLGLNRPSVPNIEFVLERFTADALANIEGDHNIALIARDILTNPRYGLGLDAARLNDSEIDAGAALLDAEGWGVSPPLKSSTTGRQFINTLLEYCDGYQAIGTDGRWSLRLVRENLPDQPILTLTADDLTEVPRQPILDWAAARNQTRVSFNNRDADFRDDAATWRDSGGFSITGENSPQTLQRPWIKRQLVARHIAGAAGAAAALPEMMLKLKVKTPAVPGDAIGRRLRLNYPGIDPDILWRVTDQSIPSPASAETAITVRHERSWINQDVYGTADDDIPGTDAANAIPAVHQAILELPYDLSLPFIDKKGTRAAPSISLLALLARPDEVTTRYSVWKKKSATSDVYDKVGTDDAFALHGTLDSPWLPSSTNTIDQSVGFLVTINSVENELVSVGLESALIDDTLIFIVNPPGSLVRQPEILSLIRAELVSGTTFKLYAVRGRYDTDKQSLLGADVWIVPRKIITPFTHGGLANKSAHTYKIQTLVDDSETPLTELDPIALTCIARPYRATRPVNIRKVASGTVFNGQTISGIYTVPSSIWFRWDFTDEQADDFWVQWRALNPPAWVSTEDYEQYDEVKVTATGTNLRLDTKTYLAKEPSTNIKPGVTTGWQSYWSLKQALPVPGTYLRFIGRFTGSPFPYAWDVRLGAGRNTYKLITASSPPVLDGNPFPDTLEVRAYATQRGMDSIAYSVLNLKKI